jgi:hypothetical protein
VFRRPGATPHAGAMSETRTTAAHTRTCASAHGVGRAWGEVAFARHASAGHTHDTSIDLTKRQHWGGVSRAPPAPRITPSSHTHTHTHTHAHKNNGPAPCCSQRALAAARAASLPWRAVGVSTQTWVRHEAERHAPPRRVMGFTRSGAHTQTQDKVRGSGECTQPRGSPTRTHDAPRDIDDKHTSVTCV